jgi:hypothetical protein
MKDASLEDKNLIPCICGKINKLDTKMIFKIQDRQGWELSWYIY